MIFDWQFKRFYKVAGGKYLLKRGDCERLELLVKLFQPKTILDLGTGTGCGAYYLAKNAIGEIYSIEQEQFWIDKAKSLISLKEQQKIDFILCSVIKKDIGWCYQGLPDMEWDMVVVDGPFPDKLTSEDIFGDIFELKLKKGAIIYLDGRINTREVMKKSGKFILLREEKEGVNYAIFVYA